jgi:hypothetical protein
MFIALPFLSPEVSALVGFEPASSSLTRTWKIYFSLSQIIPDGQYTKMRGANFKETYYWSFLGEELYDALVKREMATVPILAVNTYYFFVRRNCLFQSLKNIFKFSSETKLTAKGQRKIFEVVSMCMISSVVLMPGGHQQFQFWYIYLLPIVIMSIDLPALAVFKIFNDIFPVWFERRRGPHHIFTIGLMVYMLVIGPRLDLLVKKCCSSNSKRDTPGEKKVKKE